jgi:metallophosphoesterase superfamily enzyme
MKVTAKQQPEEFKPITLEITLETAEELEILFQLGNHGESIEEMLNKDMEQDYEIDKLLTIFYEELEIFRRLNLLNK